MAGEEISWGQRIFGWAEPESLGAINHQKELNVHNIRLVQRAFGFAALFASMYGVGAPLLASFVEARRPARRCGSWRFRRCFCCRPS